MPCRSVLSRPQSSSARRRAFSASTVPWGAGSRVWVVVAAPTMATSRTGRTSASAARRTERRERVHGRVVAEGLEPDADPGPDGQLVAVAVDEVGEDPGA